MTELIKATGIASFTGQIILVSGDVWTDNSPVAGSISWNAHQVVYNGATFNIAAGSTSNAYIYWNGASSSYSTSPTPPALADGQFIIATNIGGAHSLAYNHIANQQISGTQIAGSTITAGNMVVGTITAASAIISSIDASVITVNSLRSINVQSAAFVTHGTYLTAATTGGVGTVTVDNTVDFPASGSAEIIGILNDRNIFTYSGKTGTTFTGCAGVLANNNNSTVIPTSTRTVVIDANVNELRVFFDIGNGTIAEVVSIGTRGTTAFITAGVTTTGANGVGVIGQSNTNIGVQGTSVTGNGVAGISTSGNGVQGAVLTSGYGGKFSSQRVDHSAQIWIVPDSTNAAPAHIGQLGAIFVTSTGAIYENIDGNVNWQFVGPVSLGPGISAVITTAKITPVTGANGSMTFVNGILTAQTQAT